MPLNLSQKAKRPIAWKEMEEVIQQQDSGKPKEDVGPPFHLKRLKKMKKANETCDVLT